MIPLSKPPKQLERDEARGVFEIEALYPGYGLTIGHSLRRVLLSSLEGAAATQLRITGVPHEFSTKDGLLEDIIQVMLNVKQMRFQVHTEEPQQATLSVKGEKEVTAGDFKFPTQVEIANPDLHLATLTDKNASLEMEIQIERGVGYAPAASRTKEKQEVGTILLDAIFTPVQKVNYTVENMRVGERTDYDRLQVEIVTDGTITPENALHGASSILVSQFEIISSGAEELRAETEQAAPAKKKAASSKKEPASSAKSSETKKKSSAKKSS